MKYIKLLLLIVLCTNFFSECSQTPVQNASWWQRSKNYAASWIPQAVKNKYQAYQNKRIKDIISRKLDIMLTSQVKNPQQEIDLFINKLSRAEKKTKPESTLMVYEVIVSSLDQLIGNTKKLTQMKNDLARSGKQNIAAKYGITAGMDRLAEKYKKKSAMLNDLKKYIEGLMQNISTSSTNTADRSAANR